MVRKPNDIQVPFAPLEPMDLSFASSHHSIQRVASTDGGGDQGRPSFVTISLLSLLSRWVIVQHQAPVPSNAVVLEIERLKGCVRRSCFLLVFDKPTQILLDELSGLKCAELNVYSIHSSLGESLSRYN